MVHQARQFNRKVGFVGFSASVQQKLHEAITKQASFDTVLSVQTGIKTKKNYQSTNTTYGLEQFRAGHLDGLEQPKLHEHQKALMYLSNDVSRILGMMLRQGLERHSFNYPEMLALYSQLVGNCLSLIEKTKPDLIIFRCIPHFVADYLLFKIAQHLNIRVITLETVEALNAVYIIDDIDKKTPVIRGIYDDPAFDNKVAEVISSAKKMLSFTPDYYVEVSKQRKFNQSLRGLLLWTSYEFAKAIIGFLIGKRMLRATKSTNSGNKSEITYFEIFKEKLTARFSLVSLRNSYERLASPPPDGNYFLFAANYQPERTTIPDAGNHWNFEQIITDISHTLPDGVTLMVREHPTIFNLPGQIHYRGYLYRSNQAYENIAKLPNVVIASCDTDIGHLIKNSVGVISMTGTVAYQANIGGKPAFLYGSRWFSEAKSIHRYHQHDSLQKFINSALSCGDTNNDEQWQSLFEELKDALIPVPDLLNEAAFDVTSADYVKSIARIIEIGNENGK